VDGFRQGWIPKVTLSYEEQSAQDAFAASLNAPGQTQTADLVKSTVTKLGGIGSNNPYYDPSAFANVTQVRYGTSGRNILRGPGLVNMDASLFRNFLVTERWRLQLRAEAFNVSNTPHFGNPSANASVGGFLAITSLCNQLHVSFSVDQCCDPLA